jgi:hypothetical protein
MEASTVNGVCALCGLERYLCRSHLLPAGLYRILRDKHHLNPNPVIVSKGAAHVPTSRQIARHLLCTECEIRFHRYGEDWVLKHCYRGGKFPLREELGKTPPIFEDEEIEIYKAASIQGIDVPKLVYFAASVFWRASQRWKRLTKMEPIIQLGAKYGEQFRRYLLLEAEFPKHASLILSLSGLEKPYLSASVPLLVRARGYHEYRFTIPGCLFSLLLGKTAPPLNRFCCLARGDGHLIAVTIKTDSTVLRDSLAGIRVPDVETFFSRYGLREGGNSS